ncbi:hypothetical protein CONLIGDRAFT_58617 [Coniochaeta ligniaria NRRL 30616]|uniref:Uncharacterized protein n=1 Tax=Coniochaeta ligniaria NRRL 30616 TaxID=1408157 RepID=A0A1J7J6N6_9PEZI|nr:hypothetical protein CONLIGDRAFT_58617 [Coniochaeta ligniaria NRRL 30616]
MSQHSGASTLPRGFRFAAPRTPEPFGDNEETQLPSPPRPRLRLKRRNVSHQLSAPTQQFLASVAAADFPIPSIEEPNEPYGPSEMTSIITTFPTRNEQDMSLLAPRGRTFSPPKTPAPGYVPSLSPPRYPNWTIDSTISSVESTPDPDYESSRPSTSRSTQTSSSLFSRLSHMSEDEHCSSPQLDKDDKFVLLDDVVVANARPGLRLKGQSRKAPWTKAMSTHLWSTYVLYLEDPKVTPFRMEKSCIPPPGVCLRVAREARRSWKGSKALERAANPEDGEKSGSSTPTGESSAAYMAWPHTCAATRAHLRELCKLKAASGTRGLNFMSRSPTPFSQAAARHWNRRSTPGRSTGFAADLSMSLAISTSDSMQPHGPLAQLTGSKTEGSVEQMLSPPTPSFMLGTFDAEPSFAERRRLGSPFSAARSYGPSSSNSLSAGFDYNPVPRRQSNTMGGHLRTLQSPVRLSRSGTQKRRHTQSNVPRKRPGLVSDIWLDPSTGSGVHVNATLANEANVTTSTRLDALFGPQLPAHPLLATSSSMPDVGGQFEPSAAPPPRLGSPFSGTSSSFSFPRRTHRQHPGSVDLGMLGRPFATVQVQQAPQMNADTARTGLADRFTYIDQRLKELRNRDTRRRSESPV